MLKQHSFSNPFSGIKEKFQKSGRSNSAPGAYDIYIDRFWSLCVFVFVFFLQTRLILFLVDFESTCLVHASLIFYICLVFVYFVCLCRLYACCYPFAKEQDEWTEENIVAKLDITFICAYVCFCILCLPVCRLHACCYPFAKEQWKKTSLRCLHSPHLFTKTMHSQLSITDAWNIINNLHLTSVKKVHVSWFRQNSR